MGKKFCCLYDILITCAPAKIPGDRRADLWFTGVGVLPEKGHERHEKPGSAKATLERVASLERSLERVQVTGVTGGSKAFDRLDLMSVGLDGKDQTRAHGLAIQEHGARPAYAMLAAHVRSGEVQLVAQKVAQQQARLNGTFILGTVNRYGDRYLLTHAAPICRQ